MNKDLEALQDVQSVDLEIDRIHTNQKEFPSRINQLKQQLADEEKNLLDKIEEVKQLDLKRKKYELDLKQNDQTIQAKDQKLMSVKSNEEFKAIKKEIAQVKQESSVIEDQVLELLLQIDKANVLLSTFKVNAQAKKVEIQDEITHVEFQLSTLDSELEQQKTQRSSKVSGLNEEVYSIYNRIRSKEPLAVTETRGGKCGGCAMAIPPQLFNEIQKAQSISFCPSCQRILVYKKQ